MSSSDGGARYPAAGPLSTDAPATHGLDGVARSAGVVGGATLASRVLGLTRDIVLANLFAAGATDTFFIAFMIPNLFRRLVAEGSLTISFVPVFTDWLRRSREEARRVFNATWTLGAGAGLAIMLLGILFADPLIHLFAPGFALEPGKHELAVRLLRLCFPYILLLTLVAVAMGALNALGHFLAPAIAPVLLNLCLIGGAVAGWLWFRPPILALGAAVIVAGILQVLLQIPVLRRRGMAPRPLLAPRHPAIRRLAVLMLPAVLGASVLQLNMLVSRLLASLLGDGAVSYLYYADRLLEFPLGVFVFAIGTASLPTFSRLVKARDSDGLRGAFAGTLLLAVSLSLPSMIGLVLLAQQIFEGLFAWNPRLFGAAAVDGCARALICYALGLVPITIARIYVGYCVAHENTRTPARATVVALIVNVAASLALIGPLPEGALPDAFVGLQRACVLADLGYAGLALAASIASTANVLYLAVAVRVRYGALFTAGDLGRALRLLAATAAMAALILAVLPGWPLSGATGLAGLVALGAAGYGLALALLRSPELYALLALLRPRGGARNRPESGSL